MSTTRDNRLALALRPDGALTLWLCRLSGILLFCLGVEYWVRIVGFYDGALWRFDLMPVWWQVAAPALAVLCPVAGIGVWMTVSWGAVLWTLVVGIEGVMHAMFPNRFGTADAAVLANGAGLFVYLLLKIFSLFATRRRVPGNN